MKKIMFVMLLFLTLNSSACFKKNKQPTKEERIVQLRADYGNIIPQDLSSNNLKFFYRVRKASDESISTFYQFDKYKDFSFLHYEKEVDNERVEFLTSFVYAPDYLYRHSVITNDPYGTGYSRSNNGTVLYNREYRVLNERYKTFISNTITMEEILDFIVNYVPKDGEEFKCDDSCENIDDIMLNGLTINFGQMFVENDCPFLIATKSDDGANYFSITAENILTQIEGEDYLVSLRVCNIPSSSYDARERVIEGYNNIN